MHKKLIALSLALILLLSLLTACGDNAPKADDMPVTSKTFFTMGLPKDKTIYATVDMNLETVLHLDGEYEDTEYVIQLDAEMTTNLKDETSAMKGVSKIKGLGMDMTYPVINYTKGDTDWSQDPDTNLYETTVNPYYGPDDGQNLYGLVMEDFEEIVINENDDESEYTLTGSMNLHTSNAMHRMIYGLVGYEPPVGTLNFTGTFDASSKNLKEMTIELDAPAASENSAIDVNAFTYHVVINKIDNKPVDLPSGLPEPDRTQVNNEADIDLGNGTTIVTEPSTQPTDDTANTAPDTTVDPDTLTPVEDKNGDLVFVIDGEKTNE